MGKEISNEANKLLQYLTKNKNIFSIPFSAGNLCHRKGGRVDYVKPLLKELSEIGAVNIIKSPLRMSKYALALNDAEILEEKEDETIYTQEYRNALEEEIKKYKKFVVTTAVMGKDVNKPFVEAIRNYAKRNNALLLVLPCEDVVSRGKKAKTLELSPELNDFKVVFKDTYINRNLCLYAIKMSAKQINPLTGLERVAVRLNASIIVASPKVLLKYVPNMHYDIPPAIMSTGAVTVNNYDTEKYMSKRTSALAEVDHAYGAVIVEVENDEIFHFRHVQASPYNSLTDMGIDYLPDGSVQSMKNTVMVVGDSHTGYHDKELHEKVMEVAQEVGVKEMVLHDVFHGSSISHHDVKKGVTNSIKAKEGKLGLELECIALKNYLKNISNHGFSITIVKANHDNHLYRYLEDGRFANDPVNYQFSLKLALAATENKDPLKYAIENLLDYRSGRINWLEEDESYEVYGVECGVHGSSGANGSRGSLAVFEKGLGNCVTAHTHSGAILRNAFCVGTVGLMDMKYNKGLSSWTRTCCLIYTNGTKQLINFIPDKKGEYTCEI